MNNNLNEKKLTLSALSISTYKTCAKKWSFQNEYNLIKDYRKGNSVDNLSEKYNFSKNIVKQILNKYKFI